MTAGVLMNAILGVLFGGVTAWSIWSTEDADRNPAAEGLRYRGFGDAARLPMLLLLWMGLGLAVGGAAFAARSTLAVLFGIFLHVSVYYAFLLAALPLFRKHFSARACAVLWLLPDCLYVTLQSARFAAAPQPLVILHAPGKLAYWLLGVWLAGFVGILTWKIVSHLRFRRHILRDAQPVTDAKVLAVWKQELDAARFEKVRFRLVSSPRVTTPLSIGLARRSTRVVLPVRDYRDDELALILRHEIIHISRGDMTTKFCLQFCAAVCWFNPLMWAAMRKSADDTELSCDETVLLDADDAARQQYAALLLRTAGDERGFTTCLSATAKALQYRLKNVVKPGKKYTGALLAAVLVVALFCSRGYVALAYDGQSGAERIFGGQNPSGSTLQYVQDWTGGSYSSEYRCTDPDALKAYLASLEMEEITSALFYDDTAEDAGRQINFGFETPQGLINVELSEHRAYIYRFWERNTRDQTYYLASGPDWAYLDTILRKTE